MDHGIFLYAIQIDVLTGNEIEFIREWFETPCTLLKAKHRTCTVTLPQTNKKEEKFKKWKLQNQDATRLKIREAEINRYSRKNTFILPKFIT